MNGTRIPSTESGSIALLMLGRSNRFLELAGKHFDDVLTLRTFVKVRPLFVGHWQPALPSDVEQAQRLYVVAALCHSKQRTIANTGPVAG